MGVGVIALEVAVVQPEHAVLVQPARQPAVELAAGRLRVAFVQALPGGQQGAGTIGFDGAAFEGEVDAVVAVGAEGVPLDQAFDQLVVASGLELPAPAGEAEIEQAEPVAVAERDRTRVAQPGVVVIDPDEPDPAHVDPRRGEPRARIRLDVVTGDAHQHRLEAGDRHDQGDVRLLDLAQPLGPVRLGMRPGDQDRRLALPFGGKAWCGSGHAGVLVRGWAAWGRFRPWSPCWRRRRSRGSSRSTR